MKNTYKVAVILLAAYISMLLVQNVMNHTDANIGFAVFVMVFMFVVLYMTLYWMPSKVFGWFKKSEVHEEPIAVTKLKDDKESLKSDNLLDDDDVLMDWIARRNNRLDGVDFSHNTVDDIITLPKELFLLLFSDASTGLFFTYINTLSHKELEKFYTYLTEVVQKMPHIDDVDARTWFEEAIKLTQNEEITNVQKAQATLEMPQLVHAVKYKYLKTEEYTKFVQSRYYPYVDDALKVYEGVLTRTIYDEPMKYVADYFEQVLTQFRDFYDETNEEHRGIAAHLAKRFGLLSAYLAYIQKTIEEKHDGLEWFLDTFSDAIRASDANDIITNDRLIFELMNTYAGIVNQDDDGYLKGLIAVTNNLFRWYPVNSEACEYAMVEMMKSVALKEVNVENANAFMTFFEELPRFYEVLSYEKKSELKELINTTVANEAPKKNKIFDQEGVKNKLILLNYTIDMEDQYYKGIVEEREQSRYTLFLAEYVKLFEPFKDEASLHNAKLWGHAVTIDSKWSNYDGIIKDKSLGAIGWESPVTADIFDMTVEIPVVFEKHDGSYLSVGVPLELVELKR